MLTISSIKASDLEELAVLYEGLTGKRTNRVLMEGQFKKITDNTDYILIGAKDQEQHLVGSVMGIMCTDIVGECQPFLVLENVIVNEICRRQGIGKKLLQYIEDWARERKCHYIMLVSLIKRKDAHEFYEANGYKSGVVQGYKKYL